MDEDKDTALAGPDDSMSSSSEASESTGDYDAAEFTMNVGVRLRSVSTSSSPSSSSSEQENRIGTVEDTPDLAEVCQVAALSERDKENEDYEDEYFTIEFAASSLAAAASGIGGNEDAKTATENETYRPTAELARTQDFRVLVGYLAPRIAHGIKGLDTETPMFQFGDKIYQGHWARLLGTQLIVDANGGTPVKPS